MQDWPHCMHHILNGWHTYSGDRKRSQEQGNQGPAKPVKKKKKNQVSNRTQNLLTSALFLTVFLIAGFREMIVCNNNCIFVNFYLNWVIFLQLCMYVYDSIASFVPKLSAACEYVGKEEQETKRRKKEGSRLTFTTRYERKYRLV